MTSQAPSADVSSNTPLNSNNPVSVSEATLNFIRRHDELFPNLEIGEDNLWKVWWMSCAPAAVAARLFNCWRMAVARIVTTYRRKLFALWQSHDTLNYELANKSIKEETVANKELLKYIWIPLPLLARKLWTQLVKPQQELRPQQHL